MSNNQTHIAQAVTGALIRHIQTWLRIGTQHTTDLTIQRKVIQCNVGVWLASSIITLYILMFAWNGNEGLVRASQAQIPSCLLMLVSVIWLNHIGQLDAARWVLAGLVHVNIIVVMAFGQGTLLHIHWYFIVVAAVSAVFFPPKLWRQAVFWSLLGVALFAWFEYHGWEPHPAVFDLTPEAIYAFQTTMVTSCAVVIVVLMLQGEQSAARIEQELQSLANTDPLTQLPNRRAFRSRLAQFLEISQRDGSPLVVMMLDIDYFKRINDINGHDTGDVVLQSLGQVLQQQLRPDDTLARMGGEEFAVLMPRTTVEQAQAIAERMRIAVESSRFGTAPTCLNVTISVGLAALLPSERADIGIRAADAALYAAKQGGRNQVVVHAA